MRPLEASLGEPRLAWALLLLLAAAAILPAASGPALPALWLAAAAPGTVLLLRPSAASRLEEALRGLGRSRTARVQLSVLAALLVFVALVFSPSAALFAATGLGSALAWIGARRGAGTLGTVLGHLTALGGALTLVLVPLELALRLPAMARQFGLPSERVRQEARYDRSWEQNVFRFRSPHQQVARRAGVARVLALGDSFTWGLYIADTDSTWPARLERRLPVPVEVINMGQRGWTTRNEADLLTRLGWQLDPDLVIVQFYLNDAYESGTNFTQESGRRLYLLPEQFWQGYIRSSALSALVSRAVNGLLFGILFREQENQGRYTDASPGWQQMKAALREMGDSARSRDTPVLFVLFPDLTPGVWTPETYPARDIHTRVAREAAAAGLDTLDLAAAFAAEGGDWKRWWATPYDAHPNEAAYAVVANALADHIERHRLLRGDER
jgi:lysophospholipase L1-like esterase